MHTHTKSRSVLILNTTKRVSLAFHNINEREFESKNVFSGKRENVPVCTNIAVFVVDGKGEFYSAFQLLALCFDTKQFFPGTAYFSIAEKRGYL